MNTLTMDAIKFGTEYSKELEAEVRATRKCLEAIPHSLYGWKPHEKSTNMGYLALLVADIPRWISWIVEKSVIDFATYDHFKLSTNEALLRHFDKNVESAKRALENVTNDELAEMFQLRDSGKVLYETSKKDSVRETINHWVHHRGQLTVYMRLNNIAVPSIYGPSADDPGF
jgi:uncharacterized damage-inducible protein DinB